LLVDRKDRQTRHRIPSTKLVNFHGHLLNNCAFDLMRIFVFLVPNYKKVFILCFFKKIRNLYYLVGWSFYSFSCEIPVCIEGTCPSSQSYIPPSVKWRYPPSPLISYRRAPAGMAGLAGLKPGSCCVGCNCLVVSFVVWWVSPTPRKVFSDSQEVV
jgi:hypothetical protein